MSFEEYAKKHFEELARTEILKLKAELEDIADIRVGRSKKRLREMSWEAQERSRAEFGDDHPIVNKLRKSLEQLCYPSPRLMNYKICLMADRAVNSIFVENDHD